MPHFFFVENKLISYLMDKHTLCAVWFSEWFIHWEIFKTEWSDICVCKHIYMRGYICMVTDIFENMCYKLAYLF